MDVVTFLRSVEWQGVVGALLGTIALAGSLLPNLLPFLVPTRQEREQEVDQARATVKAYLRRVAHSLLRDAMYGDLGLLSDIPSASLGTHLSNLEVAVKTLAELRMLERNASSWHPWILIGLLGGAGACGTVSAAPWASLILGAGGAVSAGMSVWRLMSIYARVKQIQREPPFSDVGGKHRAP